MTNRSNGLIKDDMVYGHQHQLKRRIMLNYFVLGTGASYTFDIDDKMNKNVVTFSHFRDAIKENVKLDELKLWKVCINTREKGGKYSLLKKSPADTNVEEVFAGEELEPSWEIVESFQHLPKEHIHIIVQPPPPATTGLKRPISDQNMRARKLVKTNGPVNVTENFYVPFWDLDSTRSLENAIDQNLCVLLVGHFQSGKTSVLHYLRNTKTDYFYVHASAFTGGFLSGLCDLLSLKPCLSCASLRKEIENKYKDKKIVILIDEFDRFLFNSKKNKSIEDAIDQIKELTKLISDRSIGIKSIVYTGAYSIITILKDGVPQIRQVIETSSQESIDDLSQDESLSSHGSKCLLEPRPIPSPLNSAMTIQASDFTKDQHMSFFKEIQEDRDITLSEEVLDDIYSITNGYAGLEGLLALLCMEYSVNEKTLEFDKWNERFTEFRRNPTNRQIEAVNHIEKHLSDSSGDELIKNAKNLLGRFLQRGTLHSSEINESDATAIMHLQAIGIIKDLGSELFGFTSNIILDLLSTQYYPLCREGLATIPIIQEPQKFLMDVLNLLKFIYHDVIFHTLAANKHSFSEAIIQGELYALLRSAVSNPTYKIFRETRTLEGSEKKCDLWACNGYEYGIECKVNVISDNDIIKAVRQAIGYTKGRKKACSMFVFNFVPSDSIAENHKYFFPSVDSVGFYFEMVYILYSQSSRSAKIFRNYMEPVNIPFAKER